jgi:thiol-disulfide isomerase/thioredoxin
MRTIKGLIYTLSLTVALAIAASGQSLTSLDGTRVDIEGQRGKVVVLAVGASWLPLSAKQAEYTNALVKKYAGKDVVFYFVSTDSANARSKNFADDEAIRKFAFANKMNITVLRDPDGVATLKKYAIDQVPSFVILNKTGTRVGEPFGGIDPKYDITIPISKAIDKLL